MPQTRTRVMVVEDEGLIALDIEGRLRKCGYEVPAIAATGEEALRKAAETRPDLILMDIRLKGEMDGIQTAAQVRTRLNIPVIYLTAHTDKATLERAKISEPFGFLVKPLGQANLPGSIEMALYKHRAEQKLREREAWLATVLRSAGDAVLVADPECRLQFLNPLAERLTGWSQVDALGRPLKEVLRLFNSDTDEPADSALNEAIARHEPCSLPSDLLLLSRDGRKMAIEGDVAFSEGVVLTLRDVTLRKWQEQQIRQEQKMQAIGRLAGGVAHDFNNLLTVILGHSEELLGQLPENDPRRASVLEMQRAGISAASVSRQLLSFSRQRVRAPEPVDLNASLQSFSSILRRALGPSTRMLTSFDPRAGCVRADATQLEQIILNLALNARDAMPNGGEMRIETELVELDGERFIRLSVSDSGTGMTREIADHLFEPFFTTKPAGQGTGLGLAIVHETVTDLGGTITVDSQPGHGTTFEIFLPQIDRPGAQSATTEEAAPAKETRPTILLVEDQEAIRRMLQSWLERQGFRIILASDGIEGLEQARSYKGSIDLVVSDIVMPRMNGPEMVQKMASVRPGVKTLFISGYSNESPQKLGSKILAKPFTHTDLLQCVREALSGNHQNN